MGRLDELKNKAKDLVAENRDKIEQGLEKAGDKVNQKTGDKHKDKIDKGLQKAREGLDRAEGNDPGSPGTDRGTDRGTEPPMAAGPAEPPQPTTPPPATPPPPPMTPPGA